jgi:AraC-like DNA-binding protein
MQATTVTTGTAAPGPLEGLDAEVDQRVGPFSTLPAQLQQLGVDAAQVLADCDLLPAALDLPDGRIPFAATGALLDAATRRTGCEDFALQFGRNLRLAHLGAVGELAHHAATLGDALRAVAVHQCLHSRGALAFLIEDRGSACFGYSVYRALPVGAELLQDAVAGLIINGVRELVGGDWLPGEVLLARSHPASPAPYQRAFPVPLGFDAEFTGLRFPTQALQMPLPAADRRQFETLQAQIAAAEQHVLVDDLRRALRVEMLQGHSQGDRVAQVLDMHRRTLNRRLRASGVTFQGVLDEVRFNTASHFLQSTDMPLPHIACALGYAEETSFTRAFKRWSGLSPGRFRGRPQGLPAPPAGC